MIAGKLVCLLASCGLVASCGGGDSSSAPPTGQTPTPAPSPTPTPTPSYVAFEDIAHDTAFKTSCFGYYRPAPGDAPVFLENPTFGAGLAVSYRAASSSYVVSGQGFEHIFKPEDLQASSDGRAVVYSPSVDLILVIAPRDAEFARSLTLLATSNGAPYQVIQCVLGVPTQADDLPVTDRSLAPLLLGGSARINAMNYDLSASTASASYDANGKMLRLRVSAAGKRTSYGPGEPEDPNIYTLGEFEGTASITAGGSAFLGRISSPVSSDVSGNFGGSLFGPRGREVALAFQFGGSGTDGAPFSGRGTLVLRASN